MIKQIRRMTWNEKEKIITISADLCVIMRLDSRETI